MDDLLPGTMRVMTFLDHQGFRVVDSTRGRGGDRIKRGPGGSLKSSECILFCNSFQFSLQLTFLQMTSAVFSVPWTPWLDGHVLAPLESIANLVDYNSLPDFRYNHSWSLKVVHPLLNKAPEVAREALWESVVAIWRLSEVDDTAHGDSNWADYLEAWLVSVNSWSRDVFMIEIDGVNDRTAIQSSVGMLVFHYFRQS